MSLALLYFTDTWESIQEYYTHFGADVFAETTTAAGHGQVRMPRVFRIHSPYECPFACHCLSTVSFERYIHPVSVRCLSRSVCAAYPGQCALLIPVSVRCLLRSVCAAYPGQCALLGYCSRRWSKATCARQARTRTSTGATTTARTRRSITSTATPTMSTCW